LQKLQEIETLEDLRTRLTEQGRDIDFLKNSNKEKDTEIKSLKTQIVKQQERWMELNGKFEARKTALRAAHTQLDRTKKELADLRSQRSHENLLESELKQAQSEAKRLQGQIEGHEKEIAGVRAQLAERDTELEKTRSQLAERDTKLEKSRSRLVGELQAKLFSRERELAEVSRELADACESELADELEKARSELAERDHELAAARALAAERGQAAARELAAARGLAAARELAAARGLADADDLERARAELDERERGLDERERKAQEEVADSRALVNELEAWKSSHAVQVVELAELREKLKKSESVKPKEEKCDLSIFSEIQNGYVFYATLQTEAEVFARKLFGSPVHEEPWMHIGPNTALFLFNYSSGVLHGVFKPDGMLSNIPIEPTAFGGRFPHQVKFEPIHRFHHTLPEKLLVRTLGKLPAGYLSYNDTHLLIAEFFNNRPTVFVK